MFIVHNVHVLNLYFLFYLLYLDTDFMIQYYILLNLFSILN